MEETGKTGSQNYDFVGMIDYNSIGIAIQPPSLWLIDFECQSTEVHVRTRMFKSLGLDINLEMFLVSNLLV